MTEAMPTYVIGHNLRNFVCDKYKCELIVETKSKRQEDGVMLVRGIAATTNLVNGEIFTPDVLERDMHSLEGKPIVDCHSEWPHRIRIKDIIGVVRRVWWNSERQAVMFEGEVWDENAMRLLDQRIIVNWSVGYRWRWHVREEDGVSISDEIWFDHLGYLNNPGDIEADTIHTERREYDLTYEAPSNIDFKNFREMKKVEMLMHLGYRESLDGETWGGRTQNDIINEHTALIEKMLDEGLPFQINDDLDIESIRNLQSDKIDIAMRLLEQIAELDKPIENMEGERMVVEKGNSWCVVHGHPQKPGSPTDKPMGTEIKCYSKSEFGNEGAKKKAQALHTAITLSELNREDDEMAEDKDARAGTRPKEYPWGRKSAPKGFPEDRNMYGDPTNWMYPMHDKAHARNALARFAQNYERYTTEERRFVWSRLVNKALGFGIEHTYNPESSLDRMLPDSVKRRLPGYKRESVDDNQSSEVDIMPDETENKPDKQNSEGAESNDGDENSQNTNDQSEQNANGTESSQEEEGKSTEENNDESGNSEADSTDDADSSSEETEEKSDPADEERAAKKPLNKVEEALEMALRALEKNKEEPLTKGLRSILDEVKKKNSETEEDEAIRELKGKLAEREKRIAEFEAAERERKNNERVEGLLKDNIYLPAQREQIKSIVSSMDDDTFKKFRELEKGKTAISQNENGRMDEETGGERGEKNEKDEKDPYYQEIN